MNVCLKAIDLAGMDDIHIQGKLFAVGRQEEPFCSAEVAGVKRLSRKHARIFEQENNAYVVDLGSLNGTKLNGQLVADKPLKLQDADKVTFAGLTFQVELEGMTADREKNRQDELSVALTPQATTAGPPILITEFPFLVSKSEGFFHDNKLDFSAIHKYISRRHAYLFVKNGQLYLEDLHSTNGTFKGESRIEEEPVIVSDGDTVAFGNPRMGFQIKVIQPLGNEPLQTESIITSSQPIADPAGEDTKSSGSHKAAAENRAEIENSSVVAEVSQYGDFQLEPGTILVDRASPFLDIFCADESLGPGTQKQDEKTPVKPSQQKTAGQSKSTWARIMRFVSELQTALTGNSGQQGEAVIPPKFLIFMLLALVAVASFSAFIFFRDADERQIKQLMAAGQYQQAAIEANEYLADNPHDQFVIPLAFEALLKSEIPQWQAALAKQSFAAADKLLQQAIARHDNNLAAIEALRLLLLVGDFDRFINAEKVGKAAKSGKLTRLYTTEQRISSLVTAWEVDSSGHRQLLDRIASSLVDFQPSLSRFYTQLRSLSSELDLYGPAIITFKQQISSALDQGTGDALPEIILRFKGKYPGVGGINAIEEDMQNYLQFQAARAEGDPITLRLLAEQLNFQTPAFQKKRQRLISDLPSDEYIRQVRQASEYWSQGKMDAAIKSLLQLQNQSPGESLAEMIKRYRSIEELWQIMGGKEGAPYRDQQLLALYQLLDKEKDRYLMDSLSAEFSRIETQMLDQAEEYVEAATRELKKYLTNGGIWGALRLETEISSDYRRQAKILSGAYNNMSSGVDLYSGLDSPKPSTLMKLEKQLRGEVLRQRKWINDLHLVLDQQVREEKVGLLPLLLTVQEQR